MRPLVIVVLAAILMLAASLPCSTNLTISAASAESPPTVEQVLGRYYEALGGRDALEDIRSRVATGRVVDDRPYAGPVIIDRFEAYGRPGGQWAYVEHAESGEFAEGWNGSLSWRLEDGEVAAFEGPNHSKMAFLLDPQGPLCISEYFGEMRLTGIVDYEGRSVFAVETERDATYCTLYFDLASGLLTNIGYHWYLENYRAVNGVLMPHRIIAGRKGGSVTHVFDEIVANTPVSGGRFEPCSTDARSH